MGDSNRLRLRDVRAAFRLVGECIELGPDAHAWRERLFDGLCQLTGAPVAVGGESEGLFTIDPEAHPLEFFYSGFSANDRRVHQEYMARDDFMAIDPVIQCMFRPLRPVMTNNDERLLGRRVRQGSALFNEYLRPLRLDDRIMSFCRMTNEGSRSLWNGISFERSLGDTPFGARERRLVHLVHRELKPLMGNRLATCRGRQKRPLSPRLRQTLDLVLLGNSEKQIANRLVLAQSTVHEYVTALYRRYRVSGRAELMALFLHWRETGDADTGARGK
jgi:DNA-binding CsgD family transcriptional regulator